MKTKKPYTFTLNEDLMQWFKFYARDEDRSMSSLLNSFILSLKRENDFNIIKNRPKNTLKSR